MRELVVHRSHAASHAGTRLQVAHSGLAHLVASTISERARALLKALSLAFFARGHSFFVPWWVGRPVELRLLLSAAASGQAAPWNRAPPPLVVPRSNTRCMLQRICR